MKCLCFRWVLMRVEEYEKCDKSNSILGDIRADGFPRLFFDLFS